MSLWLPWGWKEALLPQQQGWGKQQNNTHTLFHSDIRLRPPLLFYVHLRKVTLLSQFTLICEWPILPSHPKVIYILRSIFQGWGEGYHHFWWTGRKGKASPPKSVSLSKLLAWGLSEYRQARLWSWRYAPITGNLPTPFYAFSYTLILHSSFHPSYFESREKLGMFLLGLPSGRQIPRLR